MSSGKTISTINLTVGGTVPNGAKRRLGADSSPATQPAHELTPSEKENNPRCNYQFSPRTQAGKSPEKSLSRSEERDDNCRGLGLSNGLLFGTCPGWGSAANDELVPVWPPRAPNEDHRAGSRATSIVHGSEGCPKQNRRRGRFIAYSDVPEWQLPDCPPTAQNARFSECVIHRSAPKLARRNLARCFAISALQRAAAVGPIVPPS